jgi:hypothetical membrane protein
VVPATAAPVLLVGGWTLAAEIWPGDYNQFSRTISGLAALGAPHRWLMTAVFAVVGVCYLLTALGLRSAAVPGRLLLAAAGVATCAVAGLPLPSEGPSVVHSSVASCAFLALAGWPLAARRNLPGSPWVLRSPVCLTAATVLFALLVWFGVALNIGTGIGLSERAAAGAQATWPAIVACGCWLRARTHSL